MTAAAMFGLSPDNFGYFVGNCAVKPSLCLWCPANGLSLLKSVPFAMAAGTRGLREKTYQLTLLNHFLSYRTYYKHLPGPTELPHLLRLLFSAAIFYLFAMEPGKRLSLPHASVSAAGPKATRRILRERPFRFSFCCMYLYRSMDGDCIDGRAEASRRVSWGREPWVS